MRTPDYVFRLTTGDIVTVPGELGGESFEWQGQCSLQELGLRDAEDDRDYVYECTSDRGDNLARAVDWLWNAEARALSIEDEDARTVAMDAAWDRFCSTEVPSDIDC